MTMTGTIMEHLQQLSREELTRLFLDAEKLDETGELPENAPLRKLTEKVLGDSFVTHMMLVSYNVYKIFAVRYNRPWSTFGPLNVHRALEKKLFVCDEG